MRQLSFFACAMLAAAAACGVEIVDLTAAAKAQSGITATASSTYSGVYTAAKAFDGDWSKNSNCSWRSDKDGGLDQWLCCQFKDSFEPGSFIMVLSYSIMYNQAWCGAGNATYPRKLPKTWTFEGSNDGETWTTLDSHENWNNWTKDAWNTFSVTETVGCFRYYRLHMTAVCNGNESHQYYVIPELRLSGIVFDTTAESEAVRVWKSADGNWGDAAKWTDGPSGQSVPAAGDVVVVPSGATVTLTESTPRYASVEVAGTLVMTNWSTRLDATDITIAAGGNITCGDAVTNDTDLSRVWLNCSNLTIAANGKIDVNYKGYAGNTSAVYKKGFGPGGSYLGGGNYSSGASHGGHGGRRLVGDYKIPIILPYDNPAAPELPGSSGVSSPWARGKNGGGAVKIEATGAVVVNGSILANGENALAHNATHSSATSWSASGSGDNHEQSGSGGSIFVTCRTFSGAGTLSAVGGGGAWPFANIPSYASGGGMIAVHYDAEAERGESVAGMTITANAGQYARYLKNKVDAYLSSNVDDKYDDRGVNAGMGTVHFTDNQIALQIAGKTLTGNVLGITNFVYEGDWEFSGGRVMFGEEGVKVAVNGDLTFSGGDSRLEIGGGATTNWDSYVVMYAGTVPNSLTVAGDLTLGGVSRLDIRAAATNGVDEFGAYVNVGGTMTIGTNCFVYAWSDCENLGSPRFEVGSLDVQTGGVFSAKHRGGRGSYSEYTTTYTSGNGSNKFGAGPGTPRGTSASVGASHGGIGGTGASGGPASVYDDPLRPCMAGSGGTAYNNQYHLSGSGGGLIYVTALNGTIRVDGTIDASGRGGTYDLTYGYGGGGSGGTIFLEANKFFGGETGRLVADGGDTSNSGRSIHCGSGGGGRIAVWCGEPWESGLKASRIAKSVNPLSGEEFSESFSYLGSYSVAAGAATGDMAHSGTDGTVWFCYIRKKKGCVVLFK